MSRKITIEPVTRIEGHARVEVDVDDSNNVTNTVFKVMDFRGWEAFLQGMQVEMMPTITPRVCGTCPQAHHLAAARTVDKCFGVKLPRAAELLRNILSFGSFVHSHGVHFFALAAPDLILGIGSDPAKRNILGLVAAAPDVATKALRLRSIGAKIVELVGGRPTHPVTLVAGGVASPLSKENRDTLKKLVDEGVGLGKELFGVGKKALLGQMDLLQSLPLETHYLATVNGGNLDFYSGDLRLMSPDKEKLDFSENDWTQYLFEEATANSYAKFMFCKTKGGDAVPYRVGPLARLNCVDKIDTPAANAELQEFRKLGGQPCHQTMMYHYARLIELLHSLEKLAELVNDDEIVSDNVRAKPSGTPKSATAHVESPRGVLIHDYKVDDNGIVTGANLIVATQQNTPAINATIGMAAQRFIDQPDAFLLNAMEASIRCYDPCLSCATHRVGDMKLDVVVRHCGKEIRRVRR